MTGVGEGGQPSSAPHSHPQEHMSKWGASPSVSFLPPPHSTKHKEKPLPQGLLPTPTWAVHSVVFSSPMAQGALGRPISLSWTVAVTRVYWSSLGPTVCAICFSEGQYTTPLKPLSTQKHLPKNQKQKTGSFHLALLVTRLVPSPM